MLTLVPVRILPALLFVLFCFSSCDFIAENQPVANKAPLSPDDKFDDLVGAFENKERDLWQHPEEVLKAIGDLSSKTVADIGAGSGYFSFRLVPLAAKVIAIEIDERFVRYLEERRKTLPEALAKNIEIRLATINDSHLDNAEADIILVVNTYIYLQNKASYLMALKKCLKPDGKIIIIDFQKKPTRMGPAVELRLAPHQVVDDLRAAGYNEVNVDNATLPYQYIITATGD